MLLKQLSYNDDLAERQGFEPWEGCPSTVFKTAAFDRSAISPIGENTIATPCVLQIFFSFFLIVFIFAERKGVETIFLFIKVKEYA